MKFNRAFLTAVHKMEVMEVEQSPNDDQVLVKVASCGLCPFELNIWDGNLNWFLGQPHPLGHEFSGTVAEVGKNVTGFKVGDKVSCQFDLGAFAEYQVCNPATLLHLAEDIDPKYALGEPQKCIMTVMRCTKPEAGDYGAVLGCGPMGLMCVQTLKGNLLAGLIAIDIDDKKLELAKKLGAEYIINSRKENVEERIREITGGHMCDFVIEGTGIPALLNGAQRYIKPTGKGKLVLMSSHHDAAKEFDFREAVNRALDIIVAHPGHSDDQADDFRRGVLLTNKGVINLKDLITHEFKLSEIQQAFEALANKPDGYIKGIVVPD